MVCTPYAKIISQLDVHNINIIKEFSYHPWGDGASGSRPVPGPGPPISSGKLKIESIVMDANGFSGKSNCLFFFEAAPCCSIFGEFEDTTHRNTHLGQYRCRRGYPLALDHRICSGAGSIIAITAALVRVLN